MAKELTESRRTRYTRRAMQDALIDLMRERPLGSITIKALCEQADVNRSTFYAHYDSIEELLHDIEDETMAWVTTARLTSCSCSLTRPASSTSSSTSAAISPTTATICRC